MAVLSPVGTTRHTPPIPHPFLQPVSLPLAINAQADPPPDPAPTIDVKPPPDPQGNCDPVKAELAASGTTFANLNKLPVGQGLQDHPSTWITYTTGEASLLTAETEENLGLLTTEGRGPLTSNFAESGGFLRTDESLEAPDIQLHMIPVLFPEAGAGEVQAGPGDAGVLRRFECGNGAHIM